MRVGVRKRCAIGPMYASAAPGSVFLGKRKWTIRPRAHFLGSLAGPRLLRCLTTLGPGPLPPRLDCAGHVPLGGRAILLGAPGWLLKPDAHALQHRHPALHHRV